MSELSRDLARRPSGVRLVRTTATEGAISWAFLGFLHGPDMDIHIRFDAHLLDYLTGPRRSDIVRNLLHGDLHMALSEISSATRPSIARLWLHRRRARWQRGRRRSILLEAPYRHQLRIWGSLESESSHTTDMVRSVSEATRRWSEAGNGRQRLMETGPLERVQDRFSSRRNYLIARSLRENADYAARRGPQWQRLSLLERRFVFIVGCVFLSCPTKHVSIAFV